MGSKVRHISTETFLRRLGKEGRGQFIVTAGGGIRSSPSPQGYYCPLYCPIEFLAGEHGAYSIYDRLGLTWRQRDQIIRAADHRAHHLRGATLALRLTMLRRLGLLSDG